MTHTELVSKLREIWENYDRSLRYYEGSGTSEEGQFFRDCLDEIKEILDAEEASVE